MIIALDYDDTYTRDPNFWDSVIQLAQNKGHKVVCITMRYPYEIDKEKFPDVEIICTNRQAKWFYIQEHNIRIDIWIDDSPYFLLNNG